MKRHLEMTITLKKHTKETMTSKAIEESVDFADAELPADKEQLDALILRRCQEMLKKNLGTELDKRLKKEGAKKFARGKLSTSRKRKQETMDQIRQDNRRTTNQQ